MAEYLDLGERLASLDYYLRTDAFKKYQLDLDNPNHAALLGYAFCTAVVLQKDVRTKNTVDKVLEAFYPEVTLAPMNQLVS